MPKSLKPLVAFVLTYIITRIGYDLTGYNPKGGALLSIDTAIDLAIWTAVWFFILYLINKFTVPKI